MTNFISLFSVAARSALIARPIAGAAAPYVVLFFFN